MLRFLLIICLGLVISNPLAAQKKSEKGPPKRLLPDAGYQKFLNEGVVKVRPHALTFQMLDPLIYGALGVGYQRRLHPRIMAEVNLGVGIGKSAIDNYGMATEDAVFDGNNEFYRPNTKATRQIFSVQTQLIHNQFGQLVNYAWGYGLFHKFSKYSTEWEASNYDKRSPVTTNSVGLVITTQTKLWRRLGLGLSLGNGIEFANIKDIPYLPDFTNINKNVQLRSEKMMIVDYVFIQAKLNYLL